MIGNFRTIIKGRYRAGSKDFQEDYKNLLKLIHEKAVLTGRTKETSNFGSTGLPLKEIEIHYFSLPATNEPVQIYLKKTSGKNINMSVSIDNRFEKDPDAIKKIEKFCRDLKTDFAASQIF